MKLYKRTWAEIDLDNLKHNFEIYRAQIPENTEIMCVVKAFAYGHSDSIVVPFLQEKLGVKWFAVSNLAEAIRLRKKGITGEILILGYTSPDEASELLEFNIIQAVMTADYAKQLSENAAAQVRCHAAVDTGMTRIGLRGTAQQIADEIVKIANTEKISLEGAFTHFAVADSLDKKNIEYTKAQKKLLFDSAEIARNSGAALKTVHCLNSAGGIFSYDERSALARLGIILYGLKPDISLELPFEIKPVMSIKSTISQVKTVEPGVDVSYGRTYTTSKPTKIATVACGYADGYPRALSNVGEIIAGGKRCRIIGRVCMDQFMCDVTDAEVKPGDRVTLIGSENGITITADDIAQLTGTIGYEIVCGISERVPRVSVENGEVTGVFKL
ncbi:MAG: alanine racemase [Oscillospiraceae bacterium]